MPKKRPAKPDNRVKQEHPSEGFLWFCAKIWNAHGLQVAPLGHDGRAIESVVNDWDRLSYDERDFARPEGLQLPRRTSGDGGKTRWCLGIGLKVGPGSGVIDVQVTSPAAKADAEWLIGQELQEGLTLGFSEQRRKVTVEHWLFRYPETFRSDKYEILTIRSPGATSRGCSVRVDCRSPSGIVAMPPTKGFRWLSPQNLGRQIGNAWLISSFSRAPATGDGGSSPVKLRVPAVHIAELSDAALARLHQFV